MNRRSNLYHLSDTCKRLECKPGIHLPRNIYKKIVKRESDLYDLSDDLCYDGDGNHGFTRPGRSRSWTRGLCTLGVICLMICAMMGMETTDLPAPKDPRSWTRRGLCTLGNLLTARQEAVRRARLDGQAVGPSVVHPQPRARAAWEGRQPDLPVRRAGDDLYPHIESTIQKQGTTFPKQDKTKRNETKQTT